MADPDGVCQPARPLLDFGSEGQCFRFSRPGPFEVQVVRVGSCTRFRPMTDDIRSGLAWGGDTGLTPDAYNGTLMRAASHGALVVAANTSSSGSGAAISDCIEQAGVDLPFTAAGHGQGGAGAINASRLNARVVQTCAVQPDGRLMASARGEDIAGTFEFPAAIMCGRGDTIASCDAPGNGRDLFEQSNVCTILNYGNGDHLVPTGSGGNYAGVVAACAAAAGGDRRAGDYIRGLFAFPDFRGEPGPELGSACLR